MGWFSRLFRGRRSEMITGPSRLPYESPVRRPRVTDDDDDDGLAGAMVPCKPLPPNLSGGIALALPEDKLAS
jgi:hypothetical protein